MAEKSMVAKLILDATSYQKGIELAKQQTSILSKEMELWKEKNNVAAGSLRALSAEAKDNAGKQAMLASQIKITTEQHTKVSAAQGENSKAALALRGKLIDLEIAQTKLNKQIGGGLTPLQNFKNGMDATATQLQKAGEKMTAFGSAMTMRVTAPLIAAGAGILKLATGAAEYADQIGVVAEKTGMSTKAVQEYNFVLNQLDVSTDVLQNSMTMFTNKLKGVEKDSGDSATAMKTLGISMEDSAGKTRPISDIYEEVIGKLSSMKNQSDRNILASSLFGRSWVELAPVLNAGSVEIERLKKQAHSLGVVMSEESIGKAQEFGDQMDALKMVFKVAGAEIGTAFMPLIKDTLIPFIQSSVIPALKSFAGHITNLINWFKGLDPTVQKIIGVVIGLLVVIGPMSFVLGGIIKGFSGLITVIKVAASVLTFLVSPIGLIIIGVVALAAGAYLLVKNWDKAVPFFQSLWTVLKSAFATGGAGIMIAVREIQLGLARFLDFTAGNLLALYSGLFGFMAKIPGIGGVFKSAQSGIDSLRGSLKGFVSSSEADLNTAKTNIGATVNETKAAWGTMTKAASELGKGMGDTIQDSVDKVKSIFKSMPAALKSTVPAHKDAGKDLGNALGDNMKLGAEKGAKAAAEAAKKAADEIKKQAVAAAEAAKKMQDAMISSVNKLNDAVISSLKRKYDTQKRMDDNALQTEMDNLDKLKTAQLKNINAVHDAAFTALDNETKGKVDAVQAQIDAIDAQQTAEEKAKQDKEELDNISGLQSKLAADTDAAQKEQILKDLNQALMDRTQRLHDDEVQAQRDSLQKQIEAIRSAADNKKIQLDNDLKAQTDNFTATYEAEKANLDIRKSNLQTFYEDRLSQAALAAEAEKLIMGKNQEEIAELLKTYGNLYEDSGKSLGERLLAGIKSYTDLIPGLVKGGVSAAGSLPASSGATGIVSTSNSLVNSLLSQMQSNSQAWHNASVGDQDKLHAKNIALSQQIESITGKAPAYDANGKWNVLSYAVGTPYVPQDMIAQIHKGEAIIPADRNRGGGGNVYVTVTGNNISSSRDTDKLLDDMVVKFKRMGIRLA